MKRSVKIGSVHETRKTADAIQGIAQAQGLPEEALVQPPVPRPMAFFDGIECSEGQG